MLGVFAYPRKKVQSRISSRLENDPLPLLSVFIDNMHVDEVQIDGGGTEAVITGNMENPGKRLIVLEGDEVEALYGRPRFTHEERVQYFALSPKEESVLDQLHSIKSRVHFILQLGYFKARLMFFIFHLNEVDEDVRYVGERYFPDFKGDDPTIAKGTRLKQQRLILELCNYRSWREGDLFGGPFFLYKSNSCMADSAPISGRGFIPRAPFFLPRGSVEP